MNAIRNRIYVALLNLAAVIAPRDTRALHEEIIHLGMSAKHEAVDAYIYKGVDW